MTTTEQIEHIEFAMVRPNLRDIPVAALPPGYNIRLFRPGDEEAWRRIEMAVGEFSSDDRARQQFSREFGARLDAMASRCYFLETAEGEAVGTTTAWMGEFQGDLIGRIHWVAIAPEHQGRGLSKPLLSTALERLAQEHDRAYLTTQTTSYRAVGLYASYGFEPVIETDSHRRAWALVQSLLAH